MPKCPVSPQCHWSLLYDAYCKKVQLWRGKRIFYCILFPSVLVQRIVFFNNKLKHVHDKNIELLYIYIEWVHINIEWLLTLHLPCVRKTLFQWKARIWQYVVVTVLTRCFWKSLSQYTDISLYIVNEIKKCIFNY